MDRIEKLLCRIDRSMKILELGPSFSPVAPKSGGWKSWSVDHADQASLREKYRNEPAVDVAKIEPVDFIWRDGELDAAIPKEHHNTFDACIASHVIEHMPNPIGFFKSAERLLKPTGVISLAIPDKRFCFDYFKNPSLTGEFLEANLLNQNRHSKKTAFNNVAYEITSDGRSGWGQHCVKNLSFVYTLFDAQRIFEDTDASESALYVDHHAWYYTPSSFRLVLLELNALDLLDWVIDGEFPSEGVEFYVTLKRGKICFASNAELQTKRLNLMTGILGDLGIQIAFLSAGQAAAGATSQGAQAPASSHLPNCRMDELVHLVRAIEMQNTEVLRCLADQDVRISKIFDVSRTVKKLLRPIRAIGRAYNNVRSRRFVI
jgi:SAM-dependent methyltransferase